MGWTLDRGRHGILCFACRGKGQVLGLHVSGVQQRFTCRDCGGTGHVKHCIACHGTGQLWLGGMEYTDCIECQGKGYPQPKRDYFQAGLVIPGSVRRRVG